MGDTAANTVIDTEIEDVEDTFDNSDSDVDIFPVVWNQLVLVPLPPCWAMGREDVKNHLFIVEYLPYKLIFLSANIKPYLKFWVYRGTFLTWNLQSFWFDIIWTAFVPGNQ